MSRELLQHALNALENFAYHGKAVGWADVATSIRAHLTRPEPMPIAWANINKHGDITRTSNKRDAWAKTPLYAAQPAPVPVPLTDERLLDIALKYWNYGQVPLQHRLFARAIESAHGIAASPEVPKP